MLHKIKKRLKIYFLHRKIEEAMRMRFWSYGNSLGKKHWEDEFINLCHKMYDLKNS